MATKQVELQGVGIIKLYKRRGSHSIRLSIAHNGDVRVTLPAWMPYHAAVKFAQGRTSWIITQRQAVMSNLIDGQLIGKTHHLKLQLNSSIAKIRTKLEGSLAIVDFPPDLASRDEAVQKAARSISIRALRSEAEELLPRRLKDLAGQHGFHYKNVSVRQLKSRWGSCNQHAEITLNLFLMQLPWQLIDYVLLHELTHTKVMRHGQPFWDELSKYEPKAKQLRKEILAHKPAF